ncbi:MAG: C2H2-type zinc finger protein [archaeon]|nr:C2H2-type zinc finger protein [archaeon]
MTFIKNRDPRVKEHLLKVREEQQKLAASREARKIAAKLTEEDMQRIELERQLHFETMMEESKHYLSRLEEEFGALNVDDEDKDHEGLYCIACRKKFKSEQAWKNHEKGKKHQQAIARLRKEVMLEDEALGISKATTKTEDNGESDEEISADDLEEVAKAFSSSREDVDPIDEEFELVACASHSDDDAGDDGVGDEDDVEEQSEQLSKTQRKLMKKKQNRQKAMQKLLQDDDSEEEPPKAAPKVTKAQMRRMKKQQSAQGTPTSSSPAPISRSPAVTSSRSPPPGAAAAQEALPSASSSSAAAKKARRRRKQKDDGSEQPSVPVEEVSIVKADPAEFRCRVCSIGFDTRNQLFTHLKKKPTHALQR